MTHSLWIRFSSMRFAVLEMYVFHCTGSRNVGDMTWFVSLEVDSMKI